MDFGLKGRSIVITGGGSGIGLACAVAFAAEGANVTAGDRKPDALSRINGPGKVSAMEVDLATADGPKRLVDRALGELGRIDVVLNNVGAVFSHRQSFMDVDDAAWQQTFALNFMAMVRTTRAALPAMVRQGGGAIVSIASDQGAQPDPRFVDYAEAKAAVVNLSKSLSIEFGPKGIRSNAVLPGPTRTPALVNNFTNNIAPRWNMSGEQAMEHFVKDVRRMPLPRLGDPEDVAALVLFLASDRAKQITGGAFRVDGGAIMGA